MRKGTRRRKVTRAEYGDAWPLTVDAATLLLEPYGRAIVKVGRTKYALNGLAAADYADIDPVWADAPDGPGPKCDIGPLIRDALALGDG